jgi:Fe-S-cluster-containing dehydrogenase component/CRP-like cAMP-binding protein
MPHEHKSRREVLDAINSIPSMKDLLSVHDGHYDHELDLEVTVYGRNYGGKKVGPYVRLLTYDPSEAVINEGEWGGNTFYVSVDGNLEVFVRTPDGTESKVAEYSPASEFGQMSVLAGVPRSATVKTAPGKKALVLEIQRPALRLLRKLNAFAERLDLAFRRHGRDNSLEELKDLTGLSPEHIADLKNIALFRVFTKNHVLLRETAPIDRLYIVKQGWLHRTRQIDGNEIEDFVGGGFCFGLEGVLKNLSWPYTVTVLGRTEVVEVPTAKLRQSVALRETLLKKLAPFAAPEFRSQVSRKPRVADRELAAQRRLIDTGLVDATNLLVMDMDLCVRCGNCSLACHQIHGQSRLLRRGIQVTRLDAPRPRALQSVLAPAVCMHCQDPECLTGCPTGAIGRFGAGQIDIDTKTCIGCGDCASQCPYNAISLIARKPKPPEATGEGLKVKFANFLRLTSDPLPPPVDATEDLVAVKCNLCSDRAGMNPPGAKRRAYSCEENCPTGALARINPRAYFTEIGKINGMLVLGPQQAAGRNIHKSDPPRRLMHVLGILLTILLTAAAVAGLREYGLGQRLVSFLNLRWITGLVGLAGIAVVMTYPARRQVYKKRAGPLRYWLLSHTYAGVIAGIMILLHGGRDAGGPLTAGLMVSFDLVIATGLLGIVLYFAAPRLLTKIEGAPLLIDDLRQRRTELRNEIATLMAGSSPGLKGVITKRVVPRFSSFGFLLRQYFRREPLGIMIERAQSKLSSWHRDLKEDERAKLNRAIELSATLTRVNSLIYLHRSLKLWLPPHVITTSLMLALMTIHIIQVIYYAAR